MVAITFVMLFLGILFSAVRATSEPGRDDKLMPLMIGAYALRLFLQAFARDLPLFSHGSGGGDAEQYEEWAWIIARIWEQTGIHFITSDELPVLGPTTLPSNMFAFVIYLNGDLTRLGCASIVACLACLTCLNVYHLAIELGASTRHVFIVTAVALFSPAFLLYTSDMYKDGPVLFFVTGALCSAFRLSQRFSLVHAVIGGLSLWALWYVRFYLVFVTTLPFAVGLVGVRAKSPLRMVLATIGIVAIFLGVASYTNAFDVVTDRATATFEQGTNRASREKNAETGSGATFDDRGSPWDDFPTKFFYTVFSPFPWVPGSIGLQIGKIDVSIRYYMIYRIIIAARRMWREDRITVLMFSSFLVPTTVMYVATFANVGLNLRQRMPIVMVGTIFALLSWKREATAEERGLSEDTSERKPARPRRLRGYVPPRYPTTT